MTVNEKIKESEFFLEKIKETYPDLREVRFYFSAFLYSTNSIFDFILAEANEKFKLGLSDTEKWYPRHFKEKAKNNQNAIECFNLWQGFKDEFESFKIGKAFKETRDINTHKISKKPKYFKKTTIPDKKEYEKNIWTQIEITGNGVAGPDSFDMATELVNKHYIKSINEKRKEKGDTEIKKSDNYSLFRTSRIRTI